MNSYQVFSGKISDPGVQKVSADTYEINSHGDLIFYLEGFGGGKSPIDAFAVGHWFEVKSDSRSNIEDTHTRYVPLTI